MVFQHFHNPVFCEGPAADLENSMVLLPIEDWAPQGRIWEAALSEFEVEF